MQQQHDFFAQMLNHLVVKTYDDYFFRKFTLLCAISNFKCVGTTLYKDGRIKCKTYSGVWNIGINGVANIYIELLKCN